jgi:hypothetical protein
MFLFCITASTQDADKQKLIDIENALAAQPTASPQLAAVCKQYFYEGPLNQVTPLGRVGMLPKSRVLELCEKPDPSDPDVKSSIKLSDLHVDMYGDTALVSYKQSGTDTGHKDPALNTTDHFGCLDTFVKRGGQWYLIGNACTPSAPLPQSEWTAAMKAISQGPKDLQQAYH